MSLFNGVSFAMSSLVAGQVVSFWKLDAGTGGSGAAFFTCTGGSGGPPLFAVSSGSSSMPNVLPAQVTNGENAITQITCATSAEMTTKQAALGVIMAGCIQAFSPGSTTPGGSGFTGVYTFGGGGGTGAILVQSALGGAPNMGSHGWSFRVGSGAFSTPVYPANFNVGPVPATVYSKVKVVETNWGKAQMVVPDLDQSTDIVKMTVSDACCSVFQESVTLVHTTDMPLSWIAGPYGEYYVCPESRCILRLGTGE